MGVHRPQATLAERMRGVENFKLIFTDVIGQFKEMDIRPSEIAGVLEAGQGFDGSSVRGYSRIEESDLMAHPDPRTFRLLPTYVTDGVLTGVFFCDIRTPDGKPFAGDPRHCLKRTLQRASRRGMRLYVGPECEFFLFRDAKGTAIQDEHGYFETIPDIIVAMGSLLEHVGTVVECVHHEVAPSQYEIDLRYDDALVMADKVLLYKWLLKKLAKQRGLYVTFMPKPIFGVNGSGMHTHQSLFRGDRNLFYSAAHPFNLSSLARQYTAGLLAHIREMTVVLNPSVNSYKRIVPGYEAPCYIGWGQRNRSSLVRIPRYRVGKKNATRVELRSPDPSCNPYLAFALMLAAGLDGIDRQLRLPAPLEDNVFHLTVEERRKRRIGELPGSLIEAISVAEGSRFMRQTLGRHIYDAYLENKRDEWDAFRTRVTDVELATILPIT